jgi:hypothetical protein
LGYFGALILNQDRHPLALRFESRSTPARTTLIKIVKRRALTYATGCLSVYLIYVMGDNDNGQKWLKNRQNWLNVVKNG